MSGRSGARPIPPVTMTTSRPAAASTGQPRPIGPRRPSESPRRRPHRARVAAPAARIVSSKPSGWKRETEMGAAEKAGSAAITNWPGRPARQGRVVGLEAQRHDVEGLAPVARRRTLGRRSGGGSLGNAAAASRAGASAALIAGRGPWRGGRTASTRTGATDRGGAIASELLADVDADRAPRDAPAAADAAGRPELLPPRRTCGSATGGSDPATRGRKLPPATLREPEREAAVPGRARRPPRRRRGRRSG